MSPIEITLFKAEHLIDLIEINDETARKAVTAEENMKRGGLGLSAMRDGKCIGCAWMLTDGEVFTVYVQVTPELLSNPKWFHRTCKYYWQYWKQAAGGKKIQAFCDRATPKNIKWAQRFGFQLTPVTVMEVK